jgi:hypothetical protein
MGLASRGGSANGRHTQVPIVQMMLVDQVVR